MKKIGSKFVLNETGQQLSELVRDVVQSKGWRQAFETDSEPRACDKTFVGVLAAEYKSCKDKEAVKEVKQNAKSQKQKFLIGNTKAKSRISLDGETPGHVASRVEAGRKVGRARHYGDEK